MRAEPPPDERAEGHNDEALVRRPVDRRTDEGGPDAPSLDLPRHARVHEHQPIAAAAVRELCRVAVQLHDEAVLVGAVDDAMGRAAIARHGTCCGAAPRAEAGDHGARAAVAPPHARRMPTLSRVAGGR
jgi:hypothetical protein